MSECNIKTFTPLIPAGQGPTFFEQNAARDALFEILTDINEQAQDGRRCTEGQLDAVCSTLANIVEEWGKGEYDIFGTDYRLSIDFMTRSEIDDMGEFNGY